MPSSKNYVRDYKQEYEIESLKRRKQRAQRNQARRMVTKRKGISAVRGKDVGHKVALSKGGATTAANLFLQSARTNRSFSRRSDGSMKSERSRHGE